MSDLGSQILLALLYDSLTPEQKIVLDILISEWEEECSEKS